MPIILVCPHCRRRARVPRNSSGRSVRCTGCQGAFVVAPGTADLTIEWGPVGTGRRFPLDPGRPFTIGRARDNDLALPGALVSRHHARLDWSEGEWRVTDEKSSNGTYVNGRRIQDIGLTDGSRIVVGEFALRLALTTTEAGDPDAPLDAMASSESVAGATAVVEAVGTSGALLDPLAETLRGEIPLVPIPTSAPESELPSLRPLPTGRAWNRAAVRRAAILLASVLVIGSVILAAIRQCG